MFADLYDVLQYFRLNTVSLQAAPPWEPVACQNREVQNNNKQTMAVNRRNAVWQSSQIRWLAQIETPMRRDTFELIISKQRDT
ncbi:hypothetical protein PG994_002197 [Apiospora phragmitis]|uniref:Uncharacterized protein n=1 Tax=Apiospora phragmitis TaxID=2905665 RepID=A0ABR1WVR8_9PEZI